MTNVANFEHVVSCTSDMAIRCIAIVNAKYFQDNTDVIQALAPKRLKEKNMSLGNG